MEMEDALSNLARSNNKVADRDERIIWLEKIKTQKAVLEKTHKAQTEYMEKIQAELKEEKRNHTIDNKSLETRIEKLIREQTSEVCELEHKLQYERIGVQTIKNAQATEMKDLKKEVSDMKF